jgi:hypothetical protein
MKEEMCFEDFYPGQKFNSLTQLPRNSRVQSA